MRELAELFKIQRVGVIRLGASIFISMNILSCAPTPQTVCDLSLNRDDYDGRTVRVSGYYTVGNQVGFFRSRECPGASIGLVVLEGEDSRDAFLKEVWRGSASDPLGEFPVEIEGKFHSHYEGREDTILVDHIRVLVSSPE